MRSIWNSNLLRVSLETNALCLELAGSHFFWMRTLCVPCEQLVSCGTLCVLVLRISITCARPCATNITYGGNAKKKINEFFDNETYITRNKPVYLII